MTEWESLGGGLTSAPAICSWGPTHLEVFARGDDQALWHRRFLDGAWGEWESLGGVLTSPPAAVSWGAGRVDVFVRGTDDALWHRWFDGQWRGWESLGGLLNFGPAVASWGPRRLDVFARGRDNGIWQRTFDDGWSDWESIARTSPRSTAGHRRRLAARRQDRSFAWFELRGNLGHRAFSGDIWRSPRPMTTGGPNAMNTSIALASWRADGVDLFLRGEDQGLVHFPGFVDRDGELHLTFPPKQLGGVLTSGPAAVARRGDRWIDVVVRGTDNGLWRTLALNSSPG